MHPLSQITNEMRLVCRKYYNGNSDGYEQMLIVFRQQKINPIIVTILLIDELNITLSEANKIVGNSHVW